MIFAYADPPYLGMGRKMYGNLHPEAARWDDPVAHRELCNRLCDEYPDGFAISLNPRDLLLYLDSLPDDVRVAAWCKTWHQIRPTTVQYAWEPVIFRGGRKDAKRTPMTRDWLACAAGRMTGTPGGKPQAFNRWVLDLLNHQPGDELVDVFPGSGGMAVTLANGVLL